MHAGATVCDRRQEGLDHHRGCEGFRRRVVDEEDGERRAKRETRRRK